MFVNSPKSELAGNQGVTLCDQDLIYPSIRCSWQTPKIDVKSFNSDTCSKGTGRTKTNIETL